MSTVAADPADHPIVLFDGRCNLCAQTVQFLIERDPDALFRFAPLQSAVAQELLADRGLADHGLDSVVLIDGQDVYVKSDAVIRIGEHLGGRYRLLGPTKHLPRRLRDGVYDIVAASRYRLFGTRERCLVPTADVRSRFLAVDAAETG